MYGGEGGCITHEQAWSGEVHFSFLVLLFRDVYGNAACRDEIYFTRSA
jgi:hypothetical protein